VRTQIRKRPLSLPPTVKFLLAFEIFSPLLPSKYEVALAQRLNFWPVSFSFINLSKIQKVHMSEQAMTSEESRARISRVHLELNPWPFFWAVVGAWIWYGALHLAHII
jgi:hypothetical protein